MTKTAENSQCCFPVMVRTGEPLLYLPRYPAINGHEKRENNQHIRAHYKIALLALDRHKLIAYSHAMDIEYDWAKNKANKATHKLDMELAILLFEESHTVIIDNRTDYGETRKIAYGYISGRECVCVFTEREKARRIISLRKANRREVNDHY